MTQVADMTPRQQLRSRALTTLLIILAVALMVIGAATLFLISREAEATAEVALVDAEVASDNAVTLAERVQIACSTGGTTARSLGDACGQAEQVVDDPTEPLPGPPGPAGPTGPEPTSAQIERAVAAYCTGGVCSDPPTPAQIERAVAAYCASGICNGTPGIPGTNGADGTDGQNGEDGQDGVPGPPGPGPSDEQVAAAVAAYCAPENGSRCAGPPGGPGTNGQDGTKGADGRGIDTLQCESPIIGGTTTITITFSDGTVESVDCTPT